MSDSGMDGARAFCGGGGGGGGRVAVRFTEWPKRQSNARAEVVPLAQPDEGEAELPPGACELCGRERTLTFHHLVPKGVHHRYVHRQLPPELAALVGEAEPTKAFLCSHGARLCRPCHSHVHRMAPNRELAERYHTIEKLAAAPYIERWVRYAAARTK